MRSAWFSVPVMALALVGCDDSSSSGDVDRNWVAGNVADAMGELVSSDVGNVVVGDVTSELVELDGPVGLRGNRIFLGRRYVQV